MIRRFFLVCFMAALVPFAAGQSSTGNALRGEALRGEAALDEEEPVTGVRALAERYLLWAETARVEGRLEEAEAALDRAQDYGAVSSDLSYCLALVRRDREKPVHSVLEAARSGIAARRWYHYSEDHARLIEAEALIRLRAWDSALESLSRTHPALPLQSIPGIEGITNGVGIVTFLRLRALAGKGDALPFRRELALALDRYPRDPRLARLFCDYARGRLPEAEDTALMDTILRRLPLLIAEDPELAWAAAPFIRDIAEARRLVAAYRAQGGKNPAAIPVALNLGVIDEAAAIAELFGPAPPAEEVGRDRAAGLAVGVAPVGVAPVGARDFPRNNPLDRALLRAVWDLLRHEGGRERFRRNLTDLTGVVTEDRDGDGYPESWTVYRGGEIREYRWDGDQDGVADWTIEFAAGEPARAVLAFFQVPDAPFALAPSALFMEIRWERYPWVLEARSERMRYRFKALDFALSPVVFGELAGTDGVLYPEADESQGRLNLRTLFAAAESLERPSVHFSGGIERVQLSRGVPLIAVELVDGRVVSVTEYQAGRKRVQRIDLDLDGRMETVRRYRWVAAQVGSIPRTGGLALIDSQADLESVESDWDGDGIFEIGEVYYPDGTVARSWDFNNDGIRDYVEESHE